MYVCILSHDGEIVLHRHMKAAPEAFLQAIALYRGGRLPQADVYPAERRATRDLLRRRTHLMRKCSELLSHVQHTNSQYNLPEIGKKIAYKANRQGVAERFDEAAVQKTIEVDLALITYYDELLKDLELYILKTAKPHDAHTLYRLQTVPGIGNILSLGLLYEIHRIECFPSGQKYLAVPYPWRTARDTPADVTRSPNGGAG